MNVIITISVGKGWDSEECWGVVTSSPQSAATGTICPQSACVCLLNVQTLHTEWSCLNLATLEVIFFFLSCK